MRFLLDTHAFLWWITDNPKLSAAARKVIREEENEVFVSAASAWEIAIKAGLGRLNLPDKPGPFLSEQISRNAFHSLPIRMDHALQVYNLPRLHRDPFDRLLVAQALLEKLTILTSDAQIAGYKVKTLW